MIRYRTLNLPPIGASAFTPVPAKNPVASSYGLVHVYGAPGTLAVAAPDSAAMPDSLTVRPEAEFSAMSHTVTPDVIFPSLYVASTANMGPASRNGANIGMALRRLCPLPIPAVDPGRVPVPVMMQFPVGERPLPWPRAFQRWPNRGDR